MVQQAALSHLRTPKYVCLLSQFRHKNEQKLYNVNKKNKLNGRIPNFKFRVVVLKVINQWNLEINDMIMILK